MTRAAAGVEIIALLASVSAIWVQRVDHTVVEETMFVRYAPAVFIAASVILMVGPIRLLLGRPAVSAGFAAHIALRVVLLTAIVTATFATAPNWAAMVMWPFGVALGGDAATTSWSIGWDPTPLRSYIQYLRSPVHLGIIGGLFGVIVYRGLGAAYHKALPIYVTFQVWVLLGVLTASWLGSLKRTEKREQSAAALTAANEEHRRAAHWLHDDICAELRLVVLKVQSRSIELDQVGELLDNLDHQLRLRQLDELLESGSVRLAEVLQPYVRRAQAHGAVIHQVPSFDEASLIVGSDVGRVFGRAAAVLTSNALNGGAETIGFAVAFGPTTVTITVTDDAGGFASDHRPAGRGLWMLEHDPVVQSLTVEPTLDGSRVSVTITRTDGNLHGSALTR